MTDRGNVAEGTGGWPRIREFAATFVSPNVVAEPVEEEPEEPTGPPASTPGCKVTWGGWFSDAGKKATLAGQAKGLTADSAQGSVTFHHHGAGLALNSEQVVSTTCTAGGRVEIHGVGEVNGQAVEYRVDLTDGGATDTFRISWNGTTPYDSGERTLAGGQIRVH